MIDRENQISTGASNDLQKATQYALSMAYQWGMTDCGLRADPTSDNPYAPALPFYSQATIAANDEKIDKFLQERYAYVKGVLKEHRDQLLSLVSVSVRTEYHSSMYWRTKQLQVRMQNELSMVNNPLLRNRRQNN